MSAPITAKQLIRHLSPYDMSRVTFQMADGLPIVAAYIDTDETGGAVITLSDQLNEEQIFQLPRR